ncbi:MAG: hypothetical protein AABW85_02845 [archaeon]
MADKKLFSGLVVLLLVFQAVAVFAVLPALIGGVVAGGVLVYCLFVDCGCTQNNFSAAPAPTPFDVQQCTNSCYDQDYSGDQLSQCLSGCQDLGGSNPPPNPPPSETVYSGSKKCL